MTTSKRIVVKGRVQGVSYRASTEREAEKIGDLSGWVRNVDNGDVEIFVQGPVVKVEALVKWCRRGPPAARVDSLEVDDVKPDPSLMKFGVRR